MEDSGYEFNKKQVGNVEQYALTIQNVIDIYAHRQIPKYRDIHKRTMGVIFVVNLKGGVSKQSRQSLSHMHYEYIRTCFVMISASRLLTLIRRHPVLCFLITLIALVLFLKQQPRQC